MPLTFWISIVAAIVISGVIGYLMGRRNSPGGPQEIEQLSEKHQQQLAEKQAELDAYREEVHQFHEKTASLFVSMATPYKELFDHLSEGYDRLGDYTQKKVLPERAGALLDGPEPEARTNNPFEASIDSEPVVSAQPRRDD